MITPRPASKIMLVNAWNLEHGELSSSERSTVEETSAKFTSRFKEFHKMQYLKTDQDSRLGEIVQNGMPNRICHSRLE